jgi:hypothetical protein
MRLFALTFCAYRTGEDGTDIAVQTAVGIIPDDTDIDDWAMETNLEVFPATEGWKDHRPQYAEITQGFPFDGTYLYWRLEDEEKETRQG